jgi:hypothetical protein
MFDASWRPVGVEWEQARTYPALGDRTLEVLLDGALLARTAHALFRVAGVLCVRCALLRGLRLWRETGLAMEHRSDMSGGQVWRDGEEDHTSAREAGTGSVEERRGAGGGWMHVRAGAGCVPL